MKLQRTATWMTPVACLLIAATAQAGHGQWTTRTYFGAPSPGPYTKARRPNPWNKKLFDCAKTPESRRRLCLLKYRIAQAQHEARLKHLRWNDYYDYINPPNNSRAGLLGRCGVYQPPSCGKHGCGKCGLFDKCGLFGKHRCEKCGLLGKCGLMGLFDKCGRGCDACDQCGEWVAPPAEAESADEAADSELTKVGFFRKSACDECILHDAVIEHVEKDDADEADDLDEADDVDEADDSDAGHAFVEGACVGDCGDGGCLHGGCGAGLRGKLHGLLGRIRDNCLRAKNRRRYAPSVAPRPPYAAYPPMNREDAVRYIEGFQYYPPYQLIRSPRDFYMFDVKYRARY